MQVTRDSRESRTTSLSKTAIEFAREVLGWDEIYGPYPDNRNAICGGMQGEYKHFDPTDLNAIVAAVHDWCKANHCQWAVFGNARHEKFEYLAVILPFDDFWEARCDYAPSPQHAILAACIEASRRLNSH